MTTTNITDQGYRWWLSMRNAPEIRAKMPMESKLSYPVGASGELRAFHYRVMDGRIVRPYTWVRALLPDIKIVELTISKERSLFSGLPAEPGEFHVDWTVEREKLMLNMLPALMRAFDSKPSGALGKQYLELFGLLTPEGLRPFYEYLNPDFFAWLRDS